MSKIRIEKAVPIPSRSDYPFDEMDVGDSFFVQNEKRASAQVAAGKFHRKTEKRFISRAEGNGARFWRVE